MKHERDDRYFIEQIILHCQRIQYFSKRFNGSVETLSNDIAYQTCIVMSILQIGENATKLSDAFKSQYSAQPWDEIIKARHKMVHHYDDIDVGFIWEIVSENIPNLRTYCKNILKDMAEEKLF